MIVGNFEHNIRGRWGWETGLGLLVRVLNGSGKDISNHEWNWP